MQYFTILHDKMYSFIIQDDQSARGLLAKPLQKFPNQLYRQPVLTFAVRLSVWMNINRVIFYLMVLSMCNLQKRLIRAAFWVLLQAMFTERLKANGTAIKITRETTNNQ